MYQKKSIISENMQQRIIAACTHVCIADQSRNNKNY
jgi:hypothetical protein